MPNTLYDKIWKEHLVDQQDDGTALLFVDRHIAIILFYQIKYKNVCWYLYDCKW